MVLNCKPTHSVASQKLHKPEHFLACAQKHLKKYLHNAGAMQADVLSSLYIAPLYHSLVGSGENIFIASIHSNEFK